MIFRFSSTSLMCCVFLDVLNVSQFNYSNFLILKTKKHIHKLRELGASEESIEALLLLLRMECQVLPKSFIPRQKLKKQKKFGGFPAYCEVIKNYTLKICYFWIRKKMLNFQVKKHKIHKRVGYPINLASWSLLYVHSVNFYNDL